MDTRQRRVDRVFSICGLESAVGQEKCGQLNAGVCVAAPSRVLLHKHVSIGARICYVKVAMEDDIFIVHPMNPRCVVIEIMIYSPDEGAREEREFLYFRDVINNQTAPISWIRPDYRRIVGHYHWLTIKHRRVDVYRRS